MVYVLLGTGFEETEAIAPIDLLRRAGVQVQTVGLNGKVVYGGHGIGLEADITVSEMDLSQLEMIVLPGGLGGVASIKASATAMDAIRYAYEKQAYVAAICAAPTILAELGMLTGRTAVCYPGCEEGMMDVTITDLPAVRDGNIITGTSAGCAVSFGLALIEALNGHAEAQRIEQQIVIR